MDLFGCLGVLLGPIRPLVAPIGAYSLPGIKARTVDFSFPGGLPARWAAPKRFRNTRRPTAATVSPKTNTAWASNGEAKIYVLLSVNFRRRFSAKVGPGTVTNSGSTNDA